MKTTNSLKDEFVVVLLVVLFSGCICRAANLQSGAYKTVSTAIVLEQGDRVLGGNRMVPWNATLSFDLTSNIPTLQVVITNAVLEGGTPFVLTVRSSHGEKLMDGSYRFTGDYMKDQYPSGTQYLFDWSFPAMSDGQLLWNGSIGWAGGHIWLVGITNVAIVQETPQPVIQISRAGAQNILSWDASYSNFSLEVATSLSIPNWSSVTNTISTAEGKASTTLETSAGMRFFRLRKL